MQDTRLDLRPLSPDCPSCGISCHHSTLRLSWNSQVQRTNRLNTVFCKILKVLRDNASWPPRWVVHTLPNAAHTKADAEYDISGVTIKWCPPPKSWDNTSLYRKSSSLVAVAVSNGHCLSFFFLPYRNGHWVWESMDKVEQCNEIWFLRRIFWRMCEIRWWLP